MRIGGSNNPVFLHVAIPVTPGSLVGPQVQDFDVYYVCKPTVGFQVIGDASPAMILGFYGSMPDYESGVVGFMMEDDIPC